MADPAGRGEDPRVNRSFSTPARVAQTRWAAALLTLAAGACTCDESLGTLEGKLDVQPSALDFGDVPVGAEKQLELTLTNRGSFVLDIEGLETSPPFIAPVLTATLAPSGETKVMIAFRPASVGAQSGKLVIRANDPDAPEVEVPLSGTGIEAAVVVDPLVVDFGEVLWTNATQPEQRTVTVTNPGTDTFELTTLELTGDGGGAFTLDPQQAVKSYGPGESGTFTVNFLPNRMGLAEGTVTLRTTAPQGEEIVVTLRGTGVGPEMDVCTQVAGGAELCASRGEEPRLDFGPLDLGQSAMGTLRVLNTGTRDLTAEGAVQGPAQDFAFAPSPSAVGQIVIPPGQDRRFEVTYTANDYAFDSILIPFGSNAAMRTTALVRAEGRVRRADISLVPTMITLSLQQGSQSDEVTVEIHNCGTAPLSIGAISSRQTSGPAQAFSLADVPAPGTMIPPGMCPQGTAGASFRILFNSAINGTYNAEVSVGSNDPLDPTATVQVVATKL